MTRNLTPAKELQLEYWKEFYKFLGRQNLPFSHPKPYPQMHYDFHPFGRKDFWISAAIGISEGVVYVHLGLSGPEAKARFRRLHDGKKTFEQSFGGFLEWREQPEKSHSHVRSYAPSADPKLKADWPRQHAWLHETIARIERTFCDAVRTL